MDTIKPIVITSRQADDHLNKIKMEHSDLLTNIQNQSARVEAYNNQQTIEERAMKQEEKTNEMDTQKMTMDADIKRMAEINKQKELEIKQVALSL